MMDPPAMLRSSCCRYWVYDWVTTQNLDESGWILADWTEIFFLRKRAADCHKICKNLYIFISIEIGQWVRNIAWFHSKYVTSSTKDLREWTTSVAELRIFPLRFAVQKGAWETGISLISIDNSGRVSMKGYLIDTQKQQNHWNVFMM